MAHLTCVNHKRRAQVSFTGAPGDSIAVIHREDGTRCIEEGLFVPGTVRYRGHVMDPFLVPFSKLPKYQALTRRQRKAQIEAEMKDEYAKAN